MKVLFLDEAGDHNLITIDKDYPIFVLGGCILDDEYYQKSVIHSFKAFKKSLFNRSDIILHFRDYARSLGDFKKMRDKSFRDEFYRKLVEYINSLDLALLACVIDKRAHKEKYDLRATDPYILSLEILVEKFVLFLQDTNDVGCIIAESRNNQLDNELNLAFLGLKITGTRFVKAKQISEKITQFVFKKKDENVAGLQIIDSIVSPIGRKSLGYKDYLPFDCIERKFRSNKEGKYLGYGMVILPKKNERPPHWQ